MVGICAADDVVCAVGVCGGWGVDGSAEADGGDVAVAFARVRLASEDREPVYGAGFVRVQAEAGEGGEGR